MLGQCGHLGDSTLDMQCRCLFRGTCPVQSWKMMAGCCFGRSSTSFRKLPNGRVGSIFWDMAAWGEDSNIFFFNAFVHEAKTLATTNLLMGSVIGFPLCFKGRRLGQLVNPHTASLASMSASSLPGMPEWPGIHLIVIVSALTCSRASTRVLWKRSIR